jgi:hypothetical protein
VFKEQEKEENVSYTQTNKDGLHSTIRKNMKKGPTEETLYLQFLHKDCHRKPCPFNASQGYMTRYHLSHDQQLEYYIPSSE